MKRSRLIALQVACLFSVILTLWGGYVSFASESWISWRLNGLHPSSSSQYSSNTTIVPSSSSADDAQQPTPTESKVVETEPAETEPPQAELPEPETDIPEPELEPLFNTSPYLNAILNPDDEGYPRLKCPNISRSRYEYLSLAAQPDSPSRELHYFFALDLRQAAHVLPRLLGSIVEAIRFLGPSACALSIVEGNSDDGTGAILQALEPALVELGLAYFERASAVDPASGERIERLAELRNLALAPLLDASRVPRRRSSPLPVPRPSTNTTVVFLNDVAACANDVLELVHQRAFQQADMTCAMDWTHVGPEPTFYDVWIARTLRGDLFFEIPPDGSWDSAWNLFWDDDQTKSRFRRMVPFQVYSCWNGGVAFGAGPLLGERKGRGSASESVGVDGRREGVRFRASREGECFAGEPTLFCKDLWWNGYGRIAVVPSVNLEYSDETGTKIKTAKGYTSRWTEAEDEEAVPIEWVDEPPDMVKCVPRFEEQSWTPWNETLA
ncbi:alpha-1,3-mannosyltransferase CMT1 [Xylariomycetidae sp. FL0641]|nr:alpha-1,3-mannosyltransferase CMT1 [Xylariomycetidae sp. FL0641]